MALNHETESFLVFIFYDKRKGRIHVLDDNVGLSFVRMSDDRV